MENHVKGTGYDIRNNHRHCKSCRYHSDDHSIIVTMISILQSCKKRKNQKSNRQSPR